MQIRMNELRKAGRILADERQAREGIAVVCVTPELASMRAAKERRRLAEISEPSTSAREAPHCDQFIAVSGGTTKMTHFCL